MNSSSSHLLTLRLIQTFKRRIFILPVVVIVVVIAVVVVAAVDCVFDDLKSASDLNLRLQCSAVGPKRQKLFKKVENFLDWNAKIFQIA